MAFGGSTPSLRLRISLLLSSHSLALAPVPSPVSSCMFLRSWGDSLSETSHRTPIELVKCKMQVQMLTPETSVAVSSPSTSYTAPTTLGAIPVKKNPPPGPISVLMSVVRNTGFRGLWLGQTGTLIRETGGGAAWFACKEFVAKQLIKRRSRASGVDLGAKDIRPWESAAAGACAGAVFNLSLFPADTVKSVMQTEEELRPRGKGFPAPTFFGTARAMYKAQGIQGLYAGCGITVARSIPSSAIIFLIYDGLSRRFSS